MKSNVGLSMDATFQSLLDHGLESSAAILTAGFSDYFVPVQITVSSLLTMVRQDSVDVELSRVIFQDGDPVGVALIARRGWTSRLAAMAIVPAARGQGVGAQCVRQILNEARVRGDKTMTLEVIEQNAPAVHLYEKCGFIKMRRLIGLTGQPHFGTSQLGLEPADVREVARLLNAYGGDDLPWQLSGETLVQAGPPAVGYRSEYSYIALTNPEAPTVTIRAIVTRPTALRRGHATQLLRAVVAAHPDKMWRVPAVFPEELQGLFTKVGLERQELTQWQMVSSLQR